MSIFHCSVQVISRSSGRSATASAAYRAGQQLADERYGVTHDYTRKAGVLHTEISTPENAPEWMTDRAQLWNGVEKAERRKDAQLAREVEVSLPHELTLDANKELLREFVNDQFVDKGMVADVAIHQGHGDARNIHAHIMLTMREIDGDGFGNKRRDWNDKQFLQDIRQRWAQYANEGLARAGEHQRIDHRSHAERGIDLQPGIHIGAAAAAIDAKGQDSKRAELQRAIKEEQREAIRENPDLIIDKVVETQAVFDRRDMARELARHFDDADEFRDMLVRVEQSPQLVQLAEPEGKTPAKYSTAEMIGIERNMIEAATALTDTPGHGVRDDRVQRAIEATGTLSDEQRRAVENVTSAGNLKIVIGDAGTGKSFAMQTARQAWESEGYRVHGAALSGIAASGLQDGSGIESRTLRRLELDIENGKDQLTDRDVIVIDEAGMIGSRQMASLLDRATEAGAKVVLAGDDKQLAAISAGASFRAICERCGDKAEITQIRRQSHDWQRQASQEFARGDIGAALDAYRSRHCVKGANTREDAKQMTADYYMADQQQHGGRAMILTHTNRDVRDLNRTVRQARIDAGEIDAGHGFQTEQGKREFSQGDRLMFLKNDKMLDVKNGHTGEIVAAEADRLTVKLDHDDRTVTVDAKQYGHVAHGYAATVHKSQGATIDRAYTLATPGMDKSLAYVAMTRHKDKAMLFASREDYGEQNTYDRLVDKLSQTREKASTLDYAADRPDVQHVMQTARSGLDAMKEQVRDKQREKQREQAERLRQAQAQAREAQQRQPQRQRGYDGPSLG